PQHATPTRDPRIERLRSGAAVDGHLQAPQAPSELAPSKTRLRGAQEQTESSIPADLQWSDRFRRPGLDGRVWALATYNGDIVAGGDFRHSDSALATHVARWDGEAWQPLGGGVTNSPSEWAVVQALLPCGNDLVAGGSFRTAGGQT